MWFLHDSTGCSIRPPPLVGDRCAAIAVIARAGDFVHLRSLRDARKKKAPPKRFRVRPKSAQRHAPHPRKSLPGRGHQRRLREGTAAVHGEPHRHRNFSSATGAVNTIRPEPAELVKCPAGCDVLVRLSVTQVEVTQQTGPPTIIPAKNWPAENAF